MGTSCRDDGIADRQRGVRVGTSVEHDADRATPSRMDGLDELALVVALHELDLHTLGLGRAGDARRDIRERLMPVLRRLAGAEQVEVGAVDDEDERQVVSHAPILSVARVNGAGLAAETRAGNDEGPRHAGAFIRWCARGDSNPHTLASTGT
jgi:hypothetical protein